MNYRSYTSFSHTYTHTHWFNMEQNKVLLQGKFSVSSKPGKVFVVELTNQFLKFQDASCGRDTDAGGVIDLRDVIGCIYRDMNRFP